MRGFGRILGGFFFLTCPLRPAPRCYPLPPARLLLAVCCPSPRNSWPRGRERRLPTTMMAVMAGAKCRLRHPTTMMALMAFPAEAKCQLRRTTTMTALVAYPAGAKRQLRHPTTMNGPTKCQLRHPTRKMNFLARKGGANKNGLFVFCPCCCPALLSPVLVLSLCYPALSYSANNRYSL